MLADAMALADNSMALREAHRSSSASVVLHSRCFGTAAAYINISRPARLATAKLKRLLTMKTRPLGNSDLNITPIGFGAWAIGGGGWAFGWGKQDDADSIAAIREALELGVNWIDTAAVYGLGHSEEVVARALEGVSSRPYVFTKCARIWDEKRQIGKSLKADSIRRECEASLRRLKVDVIDLYQIHWPEPDEDVEEGWSTLAALKREGKVRWIGVSNFNVAQMKRAAAAIRADYFLAAELLAPQPQDRGRNPALRGGQQYRRHRLLAHGFRPSHGSHDSRPHHRNAIRRLAAEQSQLSGTASESQLASGGSPPRPWHQAQLDTGRCRHRVGLATVGRHGCHRRRS